MIFSTGRNLYLVSQAEVLLVLHRKRQMKPFVSAETAGPLFQFPLTEKWVGKWEEGSGKAMHHSLFIFFSYFCSGQLPVD